MRKADSHLFCPPAGAGWLKVQSAFFCAWFLTSVSLSASIGPLTVHPTNPRYLSDGTGKAVYLTGSHHWYNLVDNSRNGPLDFAQHISFLKARNHNFMRMWAQESRTSFGTNYPNPYVTTGTSGASDGGLKFDLSQFNQVYFDRLRQRVQQAGSSGIYVSIMLFNGWTVATRASDHPWPGHPFNAANNVNGINGDPNGNGEGEETHQLVVQAVTDSQKAYIRKVVDTVNDLDNVMYEISNESPASSTAWQYAMINYLKSYQATKPKQHAVGMTFQWPDGNNQTLFNSPADWISPSGAGGYDVNPPAGTGAKVILTDTDHIWGSGGDSIWVWKSFLRGLNPIFMDNLVVPSWQDSARVAMGQTLTYANRVSLAAMTPRGDLASPSYCLANPGNEYLVYQSGSGAFTLNLSGASGPFVVEWFNPATGAVNGGSSTSGGSTLTFTPPFSGPAILYLRLTNTLPTVALTSPVDNAHITAGTDLVLTASAADSDGSISKVDFFADTNLVGTALNTPFAVTWGNVTSGSYMLTARATDNLGSITVSAPVNVLVVPNLVLHALFVSNGALQLEFSGASNREYRLEATTDFLTWQPLATNTANNGLLSFVDPDRSSFSRRFYRVVLPP
jgi:hypothetical protein